MRAFVFLASAFFVSQLPVAAQSAESVEIKINLSAGSKTYTAPMLGRLPLTLEKVMQASGLRYNASWFPNVPGYAVTIIENEPNNTNGNLGSPFWRVCINDYGAAAGLQTLTKAGDRVEWSWTTNWKCPSDP